MAMTGRFLKRKMEEYDILEVEIEALKAEVGEDQAEGLRMQAEWRSPSPTLPRTNYFNTPAIEAVMAINPNAVAHQSNGARGLHHQDPSGAWHEEPLFSSKFLREGKATYDDLHSSGNIVGEKSERAKCLPSIFNRVFSSKTAPPCEAEVIKLLANTCLAIRVAYFNEFDTKAAKPRKSYCPSRVVTCAQPTPT